MLPNFLIVGAAKCGTTSLYRYLSQHPDIFMPQWKELSFYIGDPFGPLHKVRKQKYYYAVFKKTKDKPRVGEASTSYLFDESAPCLIKNALGRIKIIISLRNPVEMSYSLYNHQVHKEGETRKTFEEALAVEEERKRDLTFRKKCYGWHANYYYFTRGLYYAQVRRYFETFGRENVFVILFDEIVADPIKVTQNAYKFLGVNDSFVPEIKIHNPGGVILNIPKFWKDRGLFLKTVSYVFSINPAKKIPHLVRNLRKKPISDINPETKRELTEKFRKDVSKLEKLIGKDLSMWKYDK
jgi:hypothetical protein